MADVFVIETSGTDEPPPRIFEIPKSSTLTESALSGRRITNRLGRREITMNDAPVRDGALGRRAVGAATAPSDRLCSLLRTL